MTSVLFVHGTGGRERAYLATFEYMEQELKKLRPNARLVRCLWGDPLGAKLNAAGASIPTYNDSQGGGADVSPEEAEVQLWKALYENPLYEIRVLALRSLQSQRTPPGKLSPAQELQRRIKSLSQAEDLRHQLTEIGIASFIDQACIVVTLVD